MSAKLRDIIYIVAFILGLAAAVCVLLGLFTPDQVQTALVVLGVVVAGVSGMAKKHLTPDQPDDMP